MVAETEARTSIDQISVFEADVDYFIGSAEQALGLAHEYSFGPHSRDRAYMQSFEGSSLTDQQVYDLARFGTGLLKKSRSVANGSQDEHYLFSSIYLPASLEGLLSDFRVSGVDTGRYLDPEAEAKRKLVGARMAKAPEGPAAVEGLVEQIHEALDVSPSSSEFTAIIGLAALRVASVYNRSDVKQRVRRSSLFDDDVKRASPLQQGVGAFLTWFRIDRSFSAMSSTYRFLLTGTPEPGSGFTELEIQALLKELRLIQQLDKPAERHLDLIDNLQTLSEYYLNAASGEVHFLRRFVENNHVFARLLGSTILMDALDLENRVSRVTTISQARFLALIETTREWSLRPSEELLAEFEPTPKPIHEEIQRAIDAENRPDQIAAVDDTISEQDKGVAELEALRANHLMPRGMVKQYPGHNDFTANFVKGRVGDGRQFAETVSKSLALELASLLYCLENNIAKRGPVMAFVSLLSASSKEVQLADSLGEASTERSINRPLNWAISNMRHLRASGDRTLLAIARAYDAYERQRTAILYVDK